MVANFLCESSSLFVKISVKARSWKNGDKDGPRQVCTAFGNDLDRDVGSRSLQNSVDELSVLLLVCFVGKHNAALEHGGHLPPNCRDLWCRRGRGPRNRASRVQQLLHRLEPQGEPRNLHILACHSDREAS